MLARDALVHTRGEQRSAPVPICLEPRNQEGSNRLPWGWLQRKVRPLEKGVPVK